MECITSQTYHIKDEFVTHSPLRVVIRPTIPGAMRPHLVFAYITHIIICPTTPGAIRPHLVFTYITHIITCPTTPGAIRPHLVFACINIVPGATWSFHLISYHHHHYHILSWWGLEDHSTFIHINNIICNASYSWILMQYNLLHIMAFYDAWIMLKHSFNF